MIGNTDPSGLKRTYPFKADETKEKWKAGTLSQLEIRYYQKSDRFLIPLQTVGHLVQGIIQNTTHESAVATLQLGADAYLV